MRMATNVTTAVAFVVFTQVPEKVVIVEVELIILTSETPCIRFPAVASIHISPGICAEECIAKLPPVPVVAVKSALNWTKYVPAGSGVESVLEKDVAPDAMLKVA